MVYETAPQRISIPGWGRGGGELAQGLAESATLAVPILENSVIFQQFHDLMRVSRKKDIRNLEILIAFDSINLTNIGL